MDHFHSLELSNKYPAPFIYSQSDGKALLYCTHDKNSKVCEVSALTFDYISCLISDSNTAVSYPAVGAKVPGNTFL